MKAHRLVPALSLALVLALPSLAQAGGRVASAIGEKVVNGQTVYVDVVVAVAPGQSDRQATDKALSDQGASRRVKPPWAGGGGGAREKYFYTGLVWSPPAVTQNYNAADEPLAAKSALTDTYATWSAVPDSLYRIAYGSNTSRCPSLVAECPGAQSYDSLNDVGWLSLGGNTLGVTWYSTSSPEADMALNTDFSWKRTCNSSGSGYDVETVFLHENGHVAGLDHARRTDSVMYPSYQAPRCTLYDYDNRSLANLY